MATPGAGSIHVRLDDLAGMRRLARSLLRDSSLADDAVQEASMAALKRGEGADSAGEMPRAWWSAVVRHVAAKIRRGRARRDQRERVAARSEALPAADVELRRLQLHR